MTDLTDPLELYRAAREKRNKLDIYRDFRQVFMATDAGQRVLGDLLHICQFHARTATQNDPYATYFREGQRSIALHILLTLETEPQAPPERQQSTEPKE